MSLAPIVGVGHNAPPVIVTLPGDARAWGRVHVRVIVPKDPRKAPFAHFYTDAKTRAFEEALTWRAKGAMRSRQPLDGPLECRVTVFIAVPESWARKKRDAALAGTIRPTGKPDWDNFAKMLDAFNGVVWIDDSQVVDGCVRKFYAETPSLRVEVEPARTGALL